MSAWLVLGQTALRVARIEAYAVTQDPVRKNIVTTVWLRQRPKPFELDGDYGDIVRRAVSGMRNG